MLSRGSRLNDSEDIKKVRKEGRIYFFGSIHLAVANNNLNKSRSAFIVGADVDKRAVQRNALRRSLRGIFQEKVGGQGGHQDIVVVVKKIKKTETTRKRVREDFQRVLEIANLVKSK